MASYPSSAEPGDLSNPQRNPWLDRSVSQPAGLPATSIANPAIDLLPAHIELWQKTLGWTPSETQQALFQQLYAHIVDGNQRLNLTRITTPEDFWEKHLWDSLSGLAPWLQDSASSAPPSELDPVNAYSSDPIRMIDIGTGGGIPGIPAAIALANTPLAPVDLTLVDSTRKKIQFLQALTQQMDLPATCLAQRAETLGQEKAYRAKYDLALVRAVGSAATCAEYALPFLKLGGQAVLFRGQWEREDTEAIAPVIDLLGGEITDIQRWQTPLTQSIRHCIFIHKDGPTPSDFPRAVGTPAKKPLT
ncbi:MAG: 16S rRNA (guanine(527)-N(7))-methyltransferase RsmG [Phormidesmis sp.]